MRIGNRVFDTGNHTYVMGILNVTPDSFSDGGKWNSLDAALRHTEQMIAEGADLIDVGGESTRPGYTAISDEEETERTAPVVEAIRARFDIPVSIDTCKSSVAEANLAAGAELVNDIWGLKADPDMASVIAKHAAACCLMHNRSEADYRDLMGDMKSDLAACIALARVSGIRKDGIMVDPGVGFGKTYEDNLEVIRRVGEFTQLGYPVLLGTSRKSVIGLTLDIPPEERVIGTAVTTVYAVQQRCGFIRVHDVRENVQAIRMTEAIRDGRQPQ